MIIMARGGLIRREGLKLPRAALAWLVILSLLAACPQVICSAEPTSGKADVLFFFTPEDYVWGSSAVNGTADAVTVSRNAASFMNKGFVYEEKSSGTYIEIGGLAPPSGSWNWTLLNWGANGSWEVWQGSARGDQSRLDT